MVAIKELPPSFAADPEVRERFSTEARTLATLSHPHIVPIYDYVERDRLCLIVMEELPGGTVWDRFTSAGLTAPTACAVVLACCAALQHAHEKGVLHLDVKPDNLMFATDAAIKVTDFGISRVISGERTLGTVDGQVLGTPAYMSPEQARGQELTKHSDVYSAGVMLYELLSGHLPWSGAQTATELLLQRLREEPTRLHSVAPHVPVALADVVMKAIRRDPEERYASAEDFGIAIASACADAWGPDWLDHAGIAITGAERLSIAARTTHRRPAATDLGPVAARTSGPAPETSISSTLGEPLTRAPETSALGEPVAPAPETTAAAPVAGPPGAPGEVVAAPVSTPDQAAFPVVRAAGGEPRIAGADLNQLDRAALVDVGAVVAQPHSSRTAFVVSAVLAVLAFVAGAFLFAPVSRSGTLRPGQVTVAGVDVARGPVTLNLSHNLPIAVRAPVLRAFAGHASLQFSAGGLPLGSVSADLVRGSGTFDTKTARFVATGSLTGRLELTGGSATVAHETFPMTATQPWYTTALGLGSILVVLAGFAYLEGALRPLRRGRRRVSAFFGCALSSVVMAVGVVGLLTALGHANPTTPGIVAVAAGAAAAGTAFAVGTRQRAVRKGVKHAVRRATRAYASPA